MTFDDELIKEVTDDFVESFSAPTEDFRGECAKHVASGNLPLGVDENDPRVVRIVDACRHMAGQEGTYHEWLKAFMLSGQGKQ